MEYLFRCSHNFTFFSRTDAWSGNHLAKKHGAKLENMEQNILKHPINFIFATLADVACHGMLTR